MKLKENIDLKVLEGLGFHQTLCDYRTHPENKGMFWRKYIYKNGSLIDSVSIYGYDFIEFKYKESLKDLIEKGLVE